MFPLARQVRELHGRVSHFEGSGNFRTHRVRFHLHSYFYTQLIAGPARSASATVRATATPPGTMPSTTTASPSTC